MTAGHYHDTGKKEIDRAILDKPRSMQTRDARKAFETHVIRG